mmetsp:Transcript_658/g.2048  ORF Transcript_658/g.2048 Transcript_658/m.2048 type:complete len:513 (-) Transcript_658:203-1741(-)
MATLFGVSLADCLAEGSKHAPSGHAPPAVEPLPDFFDFNKQPSDYLAPFIDDGADFVFPEEEFEPATDAKDAGGDPATDVYTSPGENPLYVPCPGDVLAALAARVTPPLSSSGSEATDEDDRSPAAVKALKEDGGGTPRKRRLAEMSEDKAELTRRRNREHARSTRRRKKQYVESLKQQVAELQAKQRRLEELASGGGRATHGGGGGQAEQVALRQGVIQRFLTFRTSNVVDQEQWRDLVEEHFTLLQPREPYRKLDIGRCVGNNRRLLGVSELVQDTASITLMVDKIRTLAQMRTLAAPTGQDCALRYKVDDVLCVGDKLMCHWTLSTEGLLHECSVDGMMKCSFSAENKLESMELTYDVMALARQLQSYSFVDLSASSGDQLGPKHPRTSSRLPSFAEAFAFLGDGSDNDQEMHCHKKPRAAGANSQEERSEKQHTAPTAGKPTPPFNVKEAPMMSPSPGVKSTLPPPHLVAPWPLIPPAGMAMPNPFMSTMFPAPAAPPPLLAMAGKCC